MLNPAHIIVCRNRRSALAAGAVTAALAALPASASAGPASPDLDTSPSGDSLATVFLIIGGLSLIVLLGVVISLLRAKRSEAANLPPHATSSKSAIVGSVAVAVILAGLGGLTLSGALSADESKAGTPATYKVMPLEDPNLKQGPKVELPSGPAIAVHVNGQQFLWRYSYLGKPVYSYHDLVVPVKTTVVLYVTSSDVEHNWWVPQLGTSIQAIPGYVNMGWIRADKAGTFKGSSTVPSGTNYQNMTTRVIAKPVKDFDKWLKQKATEIQESGTELSAQVKANEANTEATAGDAKPAEGAEK